MSKLSQILPLKEINKASIDAYLSNPGLKLKKTGGRTYQLLSYLGGGTYGDVFKSRDEHGQLFALKIAQYNSTAKRELSTYKRLEQCNNYTVCVYDYFVFTMGYQEWLAIVQQLFDADLHSFKATSEQLGDMLLQLLFGLACIHSLGMAHMDIKSDNLFTGQTRSGRFYKIGDPGLACEAQDCELVGSYISPDLLNTYTLRDSITLFDAQDNDIWALGVFFMKQLSVLGIITKQLAQTFLNATFTNAENGVYPYEELENFNFDFEDIFADELLDYLKSHNNHNLFGKLSIKVFMVALIHMLSYAESLAPRLSAEQLLIMIVREQGWTTEGNELNYLTEMMKRGTCAQQLNDIIYS